MNRRTFLAASAAIAWSSLARAEPRPAFDHSHAAWTALLSKHVKVAPDRTRSQVDYREFSGDRRALGAYLAALSAVDEADYARWTKPQQYAFLGNAYNAFTVEKILTRFPKLTSIRDFGRVVDNPWKDRFFTLLGKRQHLDGIEHETMRARGVFDDPRVHVAVNCASIGCPMLGNEALVADRLDRQLERLMVAFMSDRSRNRYNAQSKTLELSMIFDWYGDDFKGGGRSFLGYPRFNSVQEVGARYADLLADAPADRTALRTMSVPIRFLDYDWRLNSIDERAT
jgi:hypothetical protein